MLKEALCFTQPVDPLSKKERSFWQWHIAAFLIYFAMAFIFIDYGHSLTSSIAGHGSDPFAFIWLLAWWPWAISHHIDPLYTNLVWQPLGVYLPWVASMPLLSFLAAPLIVFCGPILAYNLYILFAPVLSAWMAYRLCLKLTEAPVAAVFGGYFFGFSSYEMAQETSALNLSATIILPALLLVVFKRLNGELSRLRFIIMSSLLLVGQFMISTEIFATIFVFGGLAWALALAYFDERKTALRRLLLDGLMIGPFVFVCLLPFLVTMFSHFGYVRLPFGWPYYFSADLLNVVIPTRLNEFGGDQFTFISRHFRGGLQEQDAYIGLPLLIIIGLFARETAAKPAGRFLIIVFALLLIASLGPHLSIDGWYSPVGLPWSLAVLLPLIGSALPSRFALFVSLTVAIMAAIWLAGAVTPRSRFLRSTLAFLACVALLNKPHPWEPIPYSRFFQPGIVQAFLGPTPRLLVLPFAINGPSSFWQQEARFSFSQTGGYLGYPPAAMQHFPAVEELFENYQAPDFEANLRDFCVATHTQYVVAGPGTSPALLAILAGLNWPNRQILDVTVFTVPASLGGATRG